MPGSETPQEMPTPDETGIRAYIRSLPIHPALLATAAGCFLLILIVFIVSLSERPSAGSGALQAWGGAAQSAQDPTSYGATVPLATTSDPTLGSSAAPIYIPPSSAQTSADGTDSFDMGAFLAQLSQGSQASTSSSTGGTPEAYSFIPQGLISTSTFARKRTALQEELFQYGNAAGDYIQSYETSHQAITQTLTDQIADRYNDQKAQAVRDIGDSLAAVGKNLANLDGVPSIAVKANLALAQSYEDIGAKLKLIPDAKTDQALLSAVQAYNTAADSFTTHYVAVAQLLSGAGVIFAPSDSGSVFTFTNSQGL